MATVGGTDIEIPAFQRLYRTALRGQGPGTEITPEMAQAMGLGQTLPAHAAEDGRTVGQAIDDAAITAEVKAKLLADDGAGQAVLRVALQAAAQVRNVAPHHDLSYGVHALDQPQQVVGHRMVALVVVVPHGARLRLQARNAAAPKHRVVVVVERHGAVLPAQRALQDR